MLVEVEVFSGAASSSLYSAGFFPVVHTPIRACRHGDRQQFDQCDQRGRGTQGRAQSNPTHAKGFGAG